MSKLRSSTGSPPVRTLLRVPDGTKSRKRPLSTSLNIPISECSPPRENKSDILVIVAEKVRNFKVKVVPGEIVIWVMLPSSYSGTVGDIERKIRSKAK